MRTALAVGPPAEKAKPRGAGKRSRGANSKAFRLATNTDENKPSAQTAQPTSADFIALGDAAAALVARLARKRRVSRRHARVIVELHFGEMAA